MTILKLALRHLGDHGVPGRLAQDILAHFATANGRDIYWEGIAPRLSKPIAERIDAAANGWLLAHRECVLPEKPAVPRDGKLLAAGEDS
jgi:hypothetical protein